MKQDVKQENHKYTDGYLKLRALSEYSGLSVRKLRELMRNPEYPLPCFRVDGSILVKKSEFDRWLEENFRWKETEVGQIVDKVVREFL